MRSRSHARFTRQRVETACNSADMQGDAFLVTFGRVRPRQRPPASGTGPAGQSASLAIASWAMASTGSTADPTLVGGGRNRGR
jgi:hypothetical protein